MSRYAANAVGISLFVATLILVATVGFDYFVTDFESDLMYFFGMRV